MACKPSKRKGAFYAKARRRADSVAALRDVMQRAGGEGEIGTVACHDGSDLEQNVLLDLMELGQVGAAREGDQGDIERGLCHAVERHDDTFFSIDTWMCTHHRFDISNDGTKLG